mgnify:CR=1 FL=1
MRLRNAMSSSKMTGVKIGKSENQQAEFCPLFCTQVTRSVVVRPCTVLHKFLIITSKGIELFSCLAWLLVADSRDMVPNSETTPTIPGQSSFI